MGSVTITGYVMAGGASTRFGFDKVRAELNGEAMLARLCKSVKEVTGSVGIVAPFERYAEFGERLVEDHWPGQGPLGGIISALIDAHTRNDEPAWCLIVGCDMPFLTREWLTYLKDRTVTTRAAVVAPQSARGLDRKSTRLNSSHTVISYAVFCLKKKKNKNKQKHNKQRDTITDNDQHKQYRTRQT